MLTAADWRSQFGHDPDQASYPDRYRLLMPPELWGDYDLPGRTWSVSGLDGATVESQTNASIAVNVPIIEGSLVIVPGRF